MHRFVFKLEALLKHRVRAEREARLFFAAVDRERIDLEAQLLRCQRDIQQAKSDWRGVMHEGGVTRFDPRAVMLQAGASIRLEGRARQVVIQLSGVHRRLDLARDRLKKANIRRRAVEWLREREFERWKAEQQRRETAELDDLAGQRVARGLLGLEHDPIMNG